MTANSPHLDFLESESIHIFREATAQFRRPVLLYSIGKDSTVLLHLARKAFWPQKPPFPLMSYCWPLQRSYPTPSTWRRSLLPLKPQRVQSPRPQL